MRLARLTLVVIAVMAFTLLGVLDVAHGNLRIGIASMLLAGANALLLLQT